MAKCEYCKREMLKSNSCVAVPVKIDGKEYDPIPFGDETRCGSIDQNERCHDCNVAVGGYHHVGCDVEECPKCHGQLISCGCLDE